MTILYDRTGAECKVWDTAGRLVFGTPDNTSPPGGTDPGTPPTAWPYPETTDSTILRMRPPAASLVKVYEVDPATPTAYKTINDAYTAVGADRSALGIRGAGPQDYALVRVAPGRYNERIRPADWTATVSTTGRREDVTIWYDYSAPGSNTAGPVLNPGGPCYLEGVTFEAVANFASEPAAGQAPAAIWLVNGAAGASTTLANVASRSNNRYLNTGAWQAGDMASVTAYRCKFEMTDGSQPVNAQTSQAWRSMNPKHRADYIHVDCEASCPEGLVVGVADLGYGAHDRFTWAGGTIHKTGANVAQFFHSSFFQERNPNNPYNCVSYATPSTLTYAGEGEHYWSEPADLTSSLPVGGVAPGSRAYYYPQAIDKVGTLATAAPDTTMKMEPNRWYILPLQVDEARTLAGFSLEVVDSSGGNLSAALWDGQVKGATFFQADRRVKPERWLSLGATAPITNGVVNIARGTYKRVRIYPGPQVWVGVKADTACTVRASSTLTQSGLALYQDSASAPGSVSGTPLTGIAPAPVVKTGVV